jgi:hypothetical protein
MINKEEVRFNNLVEILTNRADTMIPLPTGVYGYINEIRTDKFQIRLKNKVSEKEHLFTRRFESVRPIKLTYELLINFGFKELEKDCRTFLIKDKFKLEMSNGANIYYGKLWIPNVHTLQNLYFSLKGVELELSSNN